MLILTTKDDGDLVEDPELEALADEAGAVDFAWSPIVEAAGWTPDIVAVTDISLALAREARAPERCEHMRTH